MNAIIFVFCVGQALLPVLACQGQARVPVLHRVQIAGPSEPGERLVLTGNVFGSDNRPRAGAVLEVWHTDASGVYRHDNGDGPARLRGFVRTDVDGSYVVDTIKPGLYPGAKSGAHIHFKIDGGPTQTVFVDGFQPL